MDAIEIEKKHLKFLNSFLLVVFLVSLTSTLGPGITGNFFETREEPVCSFERNGEQSNVPVDRCCMHASQKLSCVEKDKRTVCRDTEEQAYVLNSEAANYCREKGFNLE